MPEQEHVMSARKWTKDLELGISVIDEEHKRIIDFLNMLDDLEKHQDAAKLEELLDGMLNFCVTCFSMEEDLLEQAGYQFFKAHRMMHETCMRRFSDIRARGIKHENIIPELRALLDGYLNDHVKVQDRDYIEAVKKVIADDSEKLEVKGGDMDDLMERHKGMI
jgi:hemerythrin